MSQTGTIFHETMLLGEDCFLEEPHWKALLLSISKPETSREEITIPECHSMVSSLWINANPTARLFRKITAIIVGLEVSNPGSILQLILEIHQTRQNLLHWTQNFQRFASERYAERHRLKLRELLDVSLAVQTVLNRLIVALEPHATEAASYEDETQAFSDQIGFLCGEAASEDLLVSDLLLAQKLGVARAAKESENDWRREIAGDTVHTVARKCVSGLLFDRWCISLGWR